MALITLDFETYYDSDYSLKKLSTEEYLRDPRFQIIMVAVKVDGGPIECYSGHPVSLMHLRDKYDWQNNAVLAHNAMFDMGILQWHLGIRPRFIYDTLSMARALVGFQTSLSLENLAVFFNLTSRKGDAIKNMQGRRLETLSDAEFAMYADYCKNDAQLCFELWQKLMPMTPVSEQRLIDWTIRAFTEPKLALNHDLLCSELVAYRARIGTLLTAVGVTDVSALRSDDQLASLLMQAGAVPPTKQNKNNETRWAFSKQDVPFMDLLDHESETVVALVEARLGTKTSIVESRIARLINIARRGLLPVPLQYCGAMANKRWSGHDKINLQNFPRNKYDRKTDTTTLSPLRQAIMAPPGRKLCVGDLSQIEARINCWHSGQTDMLELFATGGDPYADQASVIYGEEITKAMGKTTHQVQRFVGKTAVLGCGYQCGYAKFQHMLKVDARKYQFILPDESIEFATQVVQAYRKKNWAIVRFWEQCERAIEHLAAGTTFQLGPYTIARHRVWLPNNITLHYPDLKREFNEKSGRVEWTYLRMRGRSKTRTNLYGGKLDENITSCVARIVMSDAMLRILDGGFAHGDQQLAGTVHDELITTFDENYPDKDVIAFTTECMTVRPSWAPDIPLACEVSTGFNYAEAK